MAQSLNYDRAVESELRTGNRFAEHGHLVNALKTLTHAHGVCVQTYPKDSVVGQAHEFRIRRDIAAVDARLVFNGIIPNRFLNDQQRSELSSASATLLTARVGLATLAFAPEGVNSPEEHLHAEAGLADIWRGRIQIAMGALSLTEIPRQANYSAAAEFLGIATRYVLAGNNALYEVELFGQLTRLQTLTGKNRGESLRRAERAVTAAAFKDPASFSKAMSRVVRYGLEFTPAKVMSAIREGKI